MLKIQQQKPEPLNDENAVVSFWEAMEDNDGQSQRFTSREQGIYNDAWHAPKRPERFFAPVPMSIIYPSTSTASMPPRVATTTAAQAVPYILKMDVDDNIDCEQTLDNNEPSPAAQTVPPIAMDGVEVMPDDNERQSSMAQSVTAMDSDG